MANESKKYISLARLSNFLDGIKAKYSQIGHSHTVSDISDYTIDSELSSTSTNPVQNKVLDAEFEAMATAMNILDQDIDAARAEALSQDAVILAEAQTTAKTYFDELKSDVDELEKAVNGKADTSHVHAIADVTGLQDALDAKDTAIEAVRTNAANRDAAVLAEAQQSAKLYTDTVVSGKANTDHAHDDKYAEKTHDHNDDYAAKSHNHDNDYAAKTHNHNDAYYTQAQIDAKLEEMSDASHTHDNYVPTARTINSKALSADIILSASDVGALPDTTSIPDSLSDLTEDATHRTVTDTEKNTWNAKSNFSGDYNDLTNKPTIPSVSGLATEEYVDTAIENVRVNAANRDAAVLSEAQNAAKTYADSAATTAANKVKNDLLNGAGTAYDTLKELGELIDDNTDAIEALETVAANKADKTHSHAIADVSGLQYSLDNKLSLSGGTLSGTLGIGNKYELPAAYDYANGCLIDIGEAKSSTMVTIHITGNSYNTATSPIDSLFQFYDWNGGSIVSYSGINFGMPLGNMIVYRYNGRLYAYIKQTINYQTLGFTIITNKHGLNPTVTNTAAHASGYTDLVTITPKNAVSDDHTHDNYLTTADKSVIKNGDILQTTNTHGDGRKIYISKIDDAMYAFDKRYTVTANIYKSSDDSLVSTPSTGVLFDGTFENYISIPAGHYAVINISLDGWSGYPYGDFIFSHYWGGASKEIRCRVYCNYESQGIGWHDLNVVDYYSTPNNLVCKARNDYYNLTQIEVTVVAKDDDTATLSEIEWKLDRPAPKDSSVIGKHAAETLYYPLTAPSFVGSFTGNLTGTATKATQDGSGRNIVSTYATKTEVNNLSLITVDDIDTICGSTISYADLSEVEF